MISYVALAVVVDLIAQGAHLAPMLMPHVGRRLVRDRVTGPEHSVEEIRVLATTGGGARPECFIHQPDLGVGEDAGPESSVRGRPEFPGRHSSASKRLVPLAIDFPGCETTP